MDVTFPVNRVSRISRGNHPGCEWRWRLETPRECIAAKPEAEVAAGLPGAIGSWRGNKGFSPKCGVPGPINARASIWEDLCCPSSKLVVTA